MNKEVESFTMLTDEKKVLLKAVLEAGLPILIEGSNNTGKTHVLKYLRSLDN